MSPGDRNANDGFASNANEELMLQVTLGTGPDARYVCPGGTRDRAPTLRPAKVIGRISPICRQTNAGARSKSMQASVIPARVGAS